MSPCYSHAILRTPSWCRHVVRKPVATLPCYIFEEAHQTSSVLSNDPSGLGGLRGFVAFSVFFDPPSVFGFPNVFGMPNFFGFPSLSGPLSVFGLPSLLNLPSAFDLRCQAGPLDAVVQSR